MSERVHTGVTEYVAAIIDVCSGLATHEPHLRQSVPWPDSRTHAPQWLWCLGHYAQGRQTRRVIIALTDGVAEMVGEGHSVLGMALRAQRDPNPVEAGGCGECNQPEEFRWDMLHEWVNEAPVITCFRHGALAPGWMYDSDVEPGLLAWQSKSMPRIGLTER